MTQLTRREFATLAASAAAAPFAVPASARAATVTAQELFDRVKAQIGVPWKADTVDGIKAGDPSTVVTGVVTTALASIAVLRQAAKAGANVVIASQPIFYARTDARTPPPSDAVVAAKNAVIDQHKLVVMRLSDHWRLREPDPLAVGLGQAMGWAKHQVAANPRRYDIPATTVEAVVAAAAKSLGAKGGLRVVGDPKTSLRRIGVLPGSTPIAASLEMLPGVDAILGGEVREWESVEYARDVVAAGGKKALILVGRIVSEEPGMKGCAAWLETLAPGLPIRHVAAGDPYWRPL